MSDAQFQVAADATAVTEPDEAVETIEGPPVTREVKMLEEVRDDLHIGEFVDPLEALLKAPLGLPEDDLFVKRLNSKFRVRAIDNQTYETIQEQATRNVRDQRSGQVRRDLNAGLLQRLIVLYGCKHPNWNDPKVLSRYNKPLPHLAIHAALLPGEIESISEKVLELSGFGDQLEETGKD